MIRGASILSTSSRIAYRTATRTSRSSLLVNKYKKKKGTIIIK